MAIYQTLTNSFKQEVLLAVHDLQSDTIKMALYLDSADLGATTTSYTTTGETSGAGYTAGGVTLTGVTVNLSGGTAYVDFADPSWSTASFTARGALIYNASKGNKAIAVLDFGSDKTVANQTFTVVFPTATANDAVVRIA